ncbi:Cysteine--tRNA ligase [Serratia symbiotica]|nr:Cysteine--tRNA ligase [Serratia symbiotica]
MLKIFNTINHKKEEFKPINNGKVNIYVCGITLYDLCHIGHGRTFVIFDIIIRYLRYIGYSVNYVRNITNIDDKIIQRSKKNNETYHQLTQRMLKEMYIDFDALLIERPNFEPLATKYINEIIIIIKYLINRNHAYITKNGDVMFSIESDPLYGSLSNQKLKKLYQGARIKINNTKKNPLDFVLWKISKKNEPQWNSPWGMGRPGWHIECSVMNNKTIGTHLDIHGGGSDLIFPHHENEITQSRCAYDNYHINYWMHTGMVMINKEKMSKSLNNVLTIRNILNQYHAEIIRFFLMSSHYRKQLNYCKKNLEYAQISLKKLYTAIRYTTINNFPTYGKTFEIHFYNAMNDDFNIPKAFSILFELAHEINRQKKINMTKANDMASIMRKLAQILGILYQNPEEFLQKYIQIDYNKKIKIEELIIERNKARKMKNWKLADITRKTLNKMNIILEDTSQGTTWRHK